jgi:hypothetical protein
VPFNGTFSVLLHRDSIPFVVNLSFSCASFSNTNNRNPFADEGNGLHRAAIPVAAPRFHFKQFVKGFLVRAFDTTIDTVICVAFALAAVS